MKKILECVFILDRSGSMSGLEADTIGGFNAMVEKQKKEQGDEVIMSTILFDHETEVLHNRVSIQDIQPLTQKDYQVRGTTALLDAVGGAIEHVKKVHRFLGKADAPEKVLFVITTDGLENASYRYSYETIKSLISQQQELGWEFIFLGANIDAYAEARRFGVKERNVSNFMHDDAGVDASYRSLNAALGSMRRQASIDKNWKDDVDNDYLKRKK